MKIFSAILTVAGLRNIYAFGVPSKTPAKKKGVEIRSLPSVLMITLYGVVCIWMAWKFLYKSGHITPSLGVSLAILTFVAWRWKVFMRPCNKQPTAGKALYGPDRLAVTPDLARKMREEVALAASQKKVSSPTDDQWKMILSDHPATCVIAGAGSGKSTTLVLRVVFMICHLGIRPEDITVVSFTKASCKELREKIHKVLAIEQWVNQLQPADAADLESVSKSLVKTFHAALNRLAMLEYPGVKWFENLKDTERTGGKDDTDLDNPIASSSRLTELQFNLLLDAYRSAFEKSPKFRQHVIALKKLESNRDQRKNPLKVTGARDSEVTQQRAMASEIPRFKIKLSGEIGVQDIVEAFFGQGSFIENLGMEVPETLARIDSFRPQSVEFHFAAALAIFWPIFEDTLRNQTQPIMTFNRAFLLLGESHLNQPLLVPESALNPFKHLLVDEFQDISPQIVSWLRATQRRLAVTGQAVTLMAIGDDWQSIYGWRGSAPELFIEFGKHFPSSPVLNGHNECRMMENYRSIKPVITDAEQLLKPVSVKIPKAAKSKRPTEEYDHGVRVISGVDPAVDPDAVIKEIRKQLSFVNSLPKSDKNKVVVLSRRNKVDLAPVFHTP